MDKSKSGRKFHNDRVDPSQLKILLCFHCGEQFTTNANYQRHLIYEHQAMSLCYQIYHNEVQSEKSAKRKVAKEANKGKGKDDKIDSRSDASSQRRINDSKSDLFHKKADYQPKDRTESRKNSKKDDRQRKGDKVFQASMRGPEKRGAIVEAGPPQKRMKEEPVEAPAVMKQYISEPCNDICQLCGESYVNEPGEELIKHYVDKHNSSLTGMKLHLYKDTTFLRTRNSPAGPDCSGCNLKFSNLPTDYFYHLILTHMDIVIIRTKEKQPDMDNVVVETEITVSDGTVRSVNIIVRIRRDG